MSEFSALTMFTIAFSSSFTSAALGEGGERERGGGREGEGREGGRGEGEEGEGRKNEIDTWAYRERKKSVCACETER